MTLIYCINHPDKKAVAKKLCRSCYYKKQYVTQREKLLAQTKNWQTNHPEKVKASSKKWYYAHYEEKRAYSRKRYTDNPEKHVDNYLRRSYNITLEDKKQMYGVQNGLCNICHRPLESVRKACVDHDHQTNIVRALLCHPCNLVVGHIEKDSAPSVEEYIAGLVSYLKKWNWPRSYEFVG